MAINPQVSALFSVLGISANPNQITGLNTQALETLAGTAGSDYILGQAGLLDTLNGNGGNDYLEGGAGIDTVNGGAGIDTAGYANGSSGVTVTMTLNGVGTALGGDGLADTLTGIENIVGSNFNDTIIGDNLANVLAGLTGKDTLSGGAGNDTLIGGAGGDILNGGDGIDTVDYSSSPGIIDINILPTNYGGYGRGGGDANGDTFSSIENVKGSNFDDFISAQSITNVNNILDGGDGNDTILGDSGDDIIIGGLGADILYGGSLRSSWGADTFRYMSLAEILSNDRIGWFSEDDVIDLSFADADPSTTVRDPFHFSPGGVGQLQFINEHEVRVVGLSGTIYVGFADKGELFESDFLL